MRVVLVLALLASTALASPKKPKKDDEPPPPRPQVDPAVQQVMDAIESTSLRTPQRLAKPIGQGQPGLDVG